VLVETADMDAATAIAAQSPCAMAYSVAEICHWSIPN
jgi:hypothetical protein